MNKRLLVITEELPAEIRAAGADPRTKAAYYNPDGCFDSVALIDWGRDGDWPELAHPVLKMPRDQGIEAWLSSVQAADFRALMGDEIAAGWPGIPAGWLAVIRDFAPTCIRAYGVRWSGWLGLEFARTLGMPLLCSVHNVIGLAAPVLKKAPLLMAVSDEVARVCIESGADAANVVTVNNRVNRDVFKPEGEVADGPQGAPRLLCVARDVEQKNLDRLLKACEIARRELPGLQLVHVGRSSRDWSAWPFVTHFDSIPNHELPRWMRWADAFIMPSLWEGFGIVLIEAMACGTPVIAGNRPPMNEIVTERWDGLLCDPESENDIARAIREMADPVLQRRLAAPARTATEPFDAKLISRREAALYHWLTERETPLLSVITPTYNREAFIEDSVRNTLAQDYPNLELVVVNDGSRDGTAAILERLGAEFGERLTVITQENLGLPVALNAGFERARGSLLTWSADDDRYKPGALTALARELALAPDAGMVFADYEWVSENGTRRRAETGPLSELPRQNVVGLCILFTREAFEKAGRFDPDFWLAEDYEYWVRMSRVTTMIRLPRVLYEVADHGQTLTNTMVASVQEVTMRVQEHHFGLARDKAAYEKQLARLASAYKAEGMTVKGIRTALKLSRLNARAGAWALLRALTPVPLLKAWRKKQEPRA